MKSFLRIAWSVLLAGLMPAAALGATVTLAAPAGNLPTGRYHSLTYSAVLPSGRLVTPAGTSIVTGMNALGVALTPDGRFAIVSNDDERDAGLRSAVDPRTYGGCSLTVVDTSTMTVVDRYRANGATFFVGVAALRDPADPTRTLVLASGGASNVVYAFTLDGIGHLTPDQHPTIAMPLPIDQAFADLGKSFPATLTVAADGRHAYVVNQAAGTVSVIDTATRQVAGAPHPVGFDPIGLALAGGQLIVANEGTMRYGVLPSPVTAPQFRTPAADLAHASSLSFARIAVDGTLASSAFDAPPFVSSLAMDPTPDGLRVVGSAHPSSIAANAKATYAFVAMTNVDRIATVALTGTPHVVGGTELRLFDRGPYGTEPGAVALSHDGSRLYVALGGLNAIAVIDAHDPLHLHRLGLIPTGWAPSALALASDDRTLFVVNQKGFGHDSGYAGDANSTGVWSTLQRIDLGRIKLNDATRATLGATRSALAKTPVYPKAITHVVMILEENKTFDSMLGDLGYGPADPAFVQFGEAITPNLHALARRYAVAGNFFADAEESNAGHQFALAGIAGAYTERTLATKRGRGALANANQDPEDYPRVGYLFDALARHSINFRDYGDLVRVAGYDEGLAADPRTDDPSFRDAADVDAPTQGLGGLYTLDVPAPAVLAGHIDLNYPGWNPRIRDERRANEFIRDYSALVAAGKQPRFMDIWLPADHGGAGPNIPPVAEAVADGDRALGKIIAYLSHLPSWKNTVVIIEPAGTQGTRDHVDAYRTYAVVVSPYAKRGYVGSRHLSTASVLKTIDGIFNLPPLSIGDLLATDMSDFFSASAPAGFTPYEALTVPRQTAASGPRPFREKLNRT